MNTKLITITYNKLIICLFLLVSYSCSSDDNTNKMIDLFILAGQSNAQGWKGDAKYYPADSNNIDTKILFNYTFIDNSSSNGLVNMQPQAGLFPTGHFGPEVSLSRKLKTSGYNPAIFKFCKGGSSLYGDWRNIGENGYTDNMFLALSTSINDLLLKGYSVNIRCLFWIQGESDANSLNNAKSYQNNLLNLISEFRQKFKQDIVIPVILGVDEQHPDVVKFPEVVFAQKNIAKNDTSIIASSMFGFPKADSTHLTPEGLISHGEYLYQRFIYLNDKIQQ